MSSLRDRYHDNIIIFLSSMLCVHTIGSMQSPQGTQLYDPKAGGWKDLGMLDVMQVNSIWTEISL